MRQIVPIDFRARPNRQDVGAAYPRKIRSGNLSEVRPQLAEQNVSTIKRKLLTCDLTWRDVIDTEDSAASLYAVEAYVSGAFSNRLRLH
jgi:hypothetical protein